MTSRLNIASEIRPLPGTAVSSVIGGSPLDGVFNDLVAISYDTLEMNSVQSMAVIVGGLSTIPAGQTITVCAMIQHSDDEITWDEFFTCDGVVLEGPITAQPIAISLGAPLVGSKRYIRTLLKATTSSGLSSSNVLMLGIDCFESGMYVE